MSSLSDSPDFLRWNANEARRNETKSARRKGIEWSELVKIIQENLPETAPPLPYEYTDEGKRMADFKRMCDEEYNHKIDRSRLKDAKAFDMVTEWDGKYPGPLAYGVHGTSKTRSAWSVLGRLYVKSGLHFARFTVSRLLSEIEASESMKGFERRHSQFHLLLVDDLDKLNMDFGSNTTALFEFYDWVYRTHKPCVTTTNKDREWWTEKMGEAFVRRLFDEAHFPVQFTKPKESASAKAEPKEGASAF